MEQRVVLINDCQDMADYIVYAINRLINSEAPSKERFAVVKKSNTQNAVIAIRINSKIFEINMETITTRAGVSHL